MDFSEIMDLITTVNTKLHRIQIMYEFACGIPNEVSCNTAVDQNSYKWCRTRQRTRNLTTVCPFIKIKATFRNGNKIYSINVLE